MRKIGAILAATFLTFGALAHAENAAPAVDPAALDVPGDTKPVPHKKDAVAPKKPAANPSGEQSLEEAEAEAQAAGAFLPGQSQKQALSAGGQYSVKSGDTLWDICARELNNPWYWQKVWAMNPQIANPHWIYPGNVIYFSPIAETGTLVGLNAQGTLAGDKALEASEMGDTPEVVDVNAWGTVAEGGKYQLDKYLADSKGHDFFNFRRDGFISGEAVKAAGTIINSPAETVMLSENDLIYIKAGDLSSFSIGQSYQIYRQVSAVKHPKTNKNLGYKIQILGRAVVKRISDKVVTAQITQSYEDIRRGDSLRAWKSPVKDVKPQRNKVTLKGTIVGTLDESAFLGEHQITYIDKGISQGIEEGNRLFVVRQFDGSGYTKGMPISKLPYEKVGELIILSAGSNSSVALVSRSLIDLQIGDQVVMEKNY